MKKSSGRSTTSSRTPTLNSVLINESLLRQAWLRKLIDPRKDVDLECGHPQDITTEDYTRAFLRGDVAARVVNVYPEETWVDDPEVYETEDKKVTEFEKAWSDLAKKKRIYSFLLRADILSGIGRFGVLLIGIDDGLELDQPATGVGPAGEPTGKKDTKLLYLRAFDESLVTVSSLETDVRNPRYGLPMFYDIQFVDTTIGAPYSGAAGVTSGVTTSKKVHWSRVIHLADNRTSSEVYGLPRMQRVFDRLLDLKKIVGGSGEMFWKGGFPGISLESHPQLGTDVAIDIPKTKEEMENYMNGLQRYIASVGMTANSLTTQISDPNPHAEVQMRLIAIALGVPWRVWSGSEAAQLASIQDTKAWNKRLTRRRDDYINPFVLEPTVDRLIAMGVLPQPKEYMIFWPDLHTPTDLEKAEKAERKTNALAKYVQGGVDLLIPPFHYLTLILDMEDKEAQAIIDESGDRLEEERELDREAETAAADAAAAALKANGNGQPANRPAAQPPVRR